MSRGKEDVAQKTVDSFVANVSTGKFKKAFTDEDNYDRFINFVAKRGSEAGGFVIKLPYGDGVAWIKYGLKGAEDKVIAEPYVRIQAFVPEDGDFEMPEECEGFPVWVIDPHTDIG